MVDRGATSEQPAAPNGESPSEQPDNRPHALEQRVRRLEDAVAMLQDTRLLEERIVERVSSRLNCDAAHAIQEPAGVFVHAGRKLLPAALSIVRSEADNAAAPASGLRRGWVLFDAYAELRTVVRMFLDSRYKPTWPGRVVPVVLLTLILTSWVWLPGTSILPTSIMMILDKTVDLLLAFLAFKILNREVRRYRELVADLPALPRP